jgi:hypothetical protein
LRRLVHDLRQFQSDRWLRAEVLNADTDRAQLGIADTHRVMNGLADNERLKMLFLQAPIGIDPMNGNASPTEPAATIRTQSERPVVALPCGGPGPQPAVPRNAPCPCHSGLKYKRCCGATAPPVLSEAAG